VFSAFTLAYSLFEIPSGWLGDVRGPRRVLMRIVLWWSAFTMLTGAAAGFSSLVSIRFLFGAGEAGAFPNMARALSRWFPSREQDRLHAGLASNQSAGHDSPRATPWRALLASRNLFAICAMYFAYGYGLYFYFTWLPTYLTQVLGFSALRGGMFAALPFLLAGL